VRSGRVYGEGELSIEDECSLLSPKQIAHRAQSALVFVLLFVISALLVPLLREGLRSLFFLGFGYEVDYLLLSVESSGLAAAVPQGAVWWWYPLALLVPSLVVDCLILGLLLAGGTRDEDRAFLSGRLSYGDLLGTWRMALGWFCALELLSETLLFPALFPIYYLSGTEPSCYLSLAWACSSLLAGWESAIVKIAAVISGALMLAFSGLYLFSTRKSGAVT
jgi:hypothetical protein